MRRYTILWADDEIDLLKPHILFLEDKGYDVTPVMNGIDALEQCKETKFDIIFLDENMPGMTGLEVLAEIKVLSPAIPVVMITKSEEEYIMEEAIGSKIADYLIKPLNPNQILMSLKKIVDNRRLVSEKTNMSYQQAFQQLSLAYTDDLTATEWAEIYRKLVYWELEIDETEHRSMIEVLENQKQEANDEFTKFIINNYKSWITGTDEDKPLLSHQLMRKKVFPKVNENKSTYFIVIDNLRYDQWKIVEPLLSDYFTVEEEEMYYSILPTTTMYSRNAIFSGMMPMDMATFYPDLWMGEDQEGGKNMNEEAFLLKQIERLKLSIKASYHKILSTQQGKQLVDNFTNLKHNDLNVVIYNFVDMLSHARTDSKMIRELAPDESAYRSITKSWFEHSPLMDLLKLISNSGGNLVLSTDHGTVRVKKPFKIIGEKTVNDNLRYKTGRNLSYKDKGVFTVKDPAQILLPKSNLTSSYVFALTDDFFAYPNNYNYYVNHYKDTFQHGGVSLEEMIIPIISLKSKNG